MSERTVSTAQRGRMLASTIGKPVLFAVLMWLASAAGEISIPGTPVPITLQTFVMMLAGLMLSSTESVFYCMSVYFGSVGIQKTRYTLTGALVATLAGMAASVWIVTCVM